MKKDWFKLKRYPHIGLPFSHRDRNWITRYVNDENRIASHAFAPFIHKRIITRKFRKKMDNAGTRSKDRVKSEKNRDIYYASHLDSMVYGFYAEKLQVKYEALLHSLGIAECVTAYRSIPVMKKNGAERNKCNIDFANEVFNYIRESKEDLLATITYDIKSFFDSLDHKILKAQWKRIINSGNDLPADHYNIFRNLTKFSYVNEKEIFREFSQGIIVEKKSKSIATRSIHRRKYLKEKNAIAFCNKKEITTVRDKSYIKSNKWINGELRTCGIPQGSPISSILANMYLLDFDQRCSAFLDSKGGIYRRYSDDIIIVCASHYYKEVDAFLHLQISDTNLEIQESKTQTFIFKRKESNRECLQEYNGALCKSRSPLEYLGFAFDGNRTYLKSSSIAGYYRKMKRAIVRSKFFALHNRTKTKGEIFKSKLYKRFTCRGQERRRLYQRKPGTTNEWTVSKRFDWGNYLSYTSMASQLMTRNEIGRQMRKHWKKFHAELLR
jgi:hypothetical protein